MTQKIQLIEMDLPDLKNMIREVITEEKGTDGRNNCVSDDKLISRKEAAKILGISLPTLTSLVKRGQIPACHLGSKILFRKHEVLNSLKPVQLQKFNRMSHD